MKKKHPSRRLPVLRFVFETVDLVGIDCTGLGIFQAGVFFLNSGYFVFAQRAALSIVIVMDGPAVWQVLKKCRVRRSPNPLNSSKRIIKSDF